jgi:hypothetical protein
MLDSIFDLDERELLGDLADALVGVLCRRHA